MADYDFRSLSPHDFELLCRDLLQRPLGVRLESFTTGRDSGIDFRHLTKSDHVIVQCKHYAESGFEALCRVLQGKERKKLQALKPTRYFLATSVGLTPRRKQELLKILAPYCLAPGDIFGKDDVNNLLTQYEEIELQHFKLWLTSAVVWSACCMRAFFRIPIRILIVFICGFRGMFPILALIGRRRCLSNHTSVS